MKSIVRDQDTVDLDHVIEAFPPEDMPRLTAAVDSLLAMLAAADLQPGRPPRVMVAYGGGKDSTYALAFVRGMQLVLRRSGRPSFHLRVATFRHAGMPAAVMENIDRAYRALGLYHDPAAEMLVIDDDGTVADFRPDLPLSPKVVEKGRADILMAGHRSAGDGRPTFCNACNLAMVRVFGVAARHQGGVNVVVTGDSAEEQRAYYLWTTRLSQRLDLPRPAAGRAPFSKLLDMFDDISGAYDADIHGADRRARRDSADVVPDALSFFSIYSFTNYESSAHWEFLTKFLGFEFDEIAFSFSESDCGNPGLMAHLRGLKAERVHGRRYDEGIAEYVGFATRLMVKKDFPDWLVDEVRRRYGSPDGVSAMRGKMQRYARESHGLTENQLECMVFAPFVDEAARLELYLSKVLPGSAGYLPAAKACLAGGSQADGGPLIDSLEEFSGLSLPQLRVLYRSSGISGSGKSSLLRMVLDDDPHKETIMTRERPGADLTPEVISGR
jgi:hypothetical protein